LLVLGLALITVAAVTTAVVALATRAPKVAPIAASEINGKLFQGTLGDLTMQIDPDGTAYGVYTDREGILVGHFANGDFTGYWCDQPSRLPPLNEGLAKLHFVRGSERLMMDGSWIYGEEQDLHWHAGTFNAELAMPPQAALVARLQRHERCPGH
jgi:hypothetical protein